MVLEAVEVELEAVDGMDAAADPGDDGIVVPVALGVAPDGGEGMLDAANVGATVGDLIGDGLLTAVVHIATAQAVTSETLAAVEHQAHASLKLRGAVDLMIIVPSLAMQVAQALIV